MDPAIEAALPVLRLLEGCRLHAYDDKTGEPVPVGGTCEGTLSIAYGDTTDVDPGMVITQAEAEARLERKAAVAQTDAVAAIGPYAWASLDIRRRAGLISMAYNLGRSRLMGFHQMLWALQQHRWTDAATHAVDSLWAREVPQRAMVTATIFRSGVLPA